MYLTHYPRLRRDSKNEWNAETREYGLEIYGGRSLHENTGFDPGGESMSSYHPSPEEVLLVVGGMETDPGHQEICLLPVNEATRN